MLVMASAALTIAQEPQPLIEWPHWGGDTAQTKYSTASEITAANVRELELAWTWQTVARFHPALIEAELAAKSEFDRYARRLMARRAIVAEIRRANEAEMKITASRLTGLDALLSDKLIIRDGQLARWLEIRNSNLELLIKRGVAGGVIRIEARFAA